MWRFSEVKGTLPNSKYFMDFCKSHFLSWCFPPSLLVPEDLIVGVAGEPQEALNTSMIGQMLWKVSCYKMNVSFVGDYSSGLLTFVLGLGLVVWFFSWLFVLFYFLFGVFVCLFCVFFSFSKQYLSNSPSYILYFSLSLKL